MISTTLARTLENISKAGVSPTIFALLCGVPPSTLHALLQSRVRFDSEKELAMYKTSVKVCELVAALRPLTFAKVDWEPFKELLEGPRTAEEIRSLIDQVFARAVAAKEETKC